MYARRKKIALDHVTCDVTHEKSHVADCEGCEANPGKIDVFHRRIRVSRAISTRRPGNPSSPSPTNAPSTAPCTHQARIETELVEE